MPSRYKYDDAYEKYQPFSLRDEFRTAEKYLLLDEEHRNEEVFDAVDEIYHWLCVKTSEVEELKAELEKSRGLVGGKFCDYCGCSHSGDNRVQKTSVSLIQIGRIRHRSETNVMICEECAEKFLRAAMAHLVGYLSGTEECR